MPAPPVIEFDTAGNVIPDVGRSRRRLRVAATGARHHRSTRRTACGSAVTARRTRIFWCSHAREVCEADRSPGQKRRQQRHRQPGARNPDARRRLSQRSLRLRRRANQNHRVIVFDSETGAYKRHWGAYGETRRCGGRAPVVPGGPPPKQFGSAVHCVRFDRDASSMSAIAATAGFRSFARTARSRKRFSSRRAGHRRNRLRPRVLARSAVPLRGRRRESESLDSPPRPAAGRRIVRRARARCRTVCDLTARLDCRFEGQHLHGRGGSRRTRAEVRAAICGER